MSEVSLWTRTAVWPARGRIATALSDVSVLTAVFAATLFVSAALLFLVEPMFAKMVLPRLGGSPAVWNTCVVFFQATMLVGYAYAYLATRYLSLSQQAGLHVALVAAAGLTLPVVIPDGWMPATGTTPIPALLLLLITSLGGPFFAVSSTAPLLQKWFAETDQAGAHDPYFLYAASNLGSIAALLAYPFVVEPSFRLSTQSFAWSAAYAAFAILIVAAAVGFLRRAVSRTRVAGAADEREAHLTWSRRFRWLMLACVPSSLLLGVTTFLSTDIAAVPLLWTIPLVLYLLTFVIAFASRRFVEATVAGRAAVVLAIVIVVVTMIGVKQPIWLLVPLHLFGFFVAALALHTRLVDDRPGTRSLTEFYLWIAIGGLVGGMFNTLLAPLLFSSVLEYPFALALVVALVAPMGRRAAERITVADITLPVAMGVVVTGVLLGFKNNALGDAGGSAAIGIAAMLSAACLRHRRRLALGLAVIVFGVSVVVQRSDLLYAERTFFGVLRVTTDASTGRHRLFHGGTLHGEQSLDAAHRIDPLTYYHRTGPIGQTFDALSGRLQHVAVIGLGAGSLAAYARPGQQFTFYEIDPAVERIARRPEFFTFLTDCGGRCEVVLGDARLSLTRKASTYDMIVLDAFSSDAIPAHLVTREALALYLSRLAPDGVIAFHISNQFLDLRPLVGALATERGLSARVQRHHGDLASGVASSMWVVAARTPDALGPLATDSRWQRLSAGSVRIWTDEYSDIVSVLGRP